MDPWIASMLGRNDSSGVSFSVPLLKATILNNFLVALQFSAALFFDIPLRVGALGAAAGVTED
jgi:hypothetical protein